MTIDTMQLLLFAQEKSRVITLRINELAEIKPGYKVLDIATGNGEPSITAVKKVGSSGKGHVLATDISPQMLSFARQRAASLGLQGIIEFKEGDAQTIDLPPSTFDAALCRWGIDVLARSESWGQSLY
jgi:enediyne biosynthesis protein CalE5